MQGQHMKLDRERALHTALGKEKERKKERAKEVLHSLLPI